MYTQVNSWPWSSMKPYFCQDSCITGSHYTLQVHLHLKVDNFLGLSRQAQDICLCQSTARGKGKRMICTCWWPHLTWSASAVLLQSTSFLGQVQQLHKYNLPHLLLTPNLWSCWIWPRREAIWVYRNFFFYLLIFMNEKTLLRICFKQYLVFDICN